MEKRLQLQEANRSPQNDRAGTLSNSQNGPNSRFPHGASSYYNPRQHESDIPYSTFNRQHGGASVTPGFSLYPGVIQAEVSNFRGNPQEWMNHQHVFQPYAAHIMAPHTPPLWQPLHPTYPPSLQPLPHQNPVFSISDQGNLESQALTNHVDPLENEPIQTMDTIKWKMQFGRHEIDFCPKCNKDLIHRSSNFRMQIDGIHREEDCKEQQSLNKRFRLRMLNKRMECEASNAHASAGEQDGQDASSAVDSTSRTAIVQSPIAKPRVRLPPASVDKEKEEPRSATAR